ncbi:unnamed protein product [Peronospora belbahrii]|uniref:Mitochondrial splicing suppressor 51-like C-terminal domain-containing protein n=1 Tax=Peronospora belbahrii TaxID=622444 RepID=A0AAU9L6H2_9STRA|nr:unnamed protein product [Peronospora belbahrii]CAH0520021.1 unnamed protein product [Peronospora belbahrii]
MTSIHETRAATLVEWLERLEQHRYNDDTITTYKTKKQLIVHLLGADYREGNTGSETLTVFERFIQHVATQTDVTLLQLVLVGPNVARKLHLQEFLQTTYKSSENIDEDDNTLYVDIQYFVGCFEVYFKDKTFYCPPDLVICFNAGIWGYDEWLPAIQLVLREIQVPLLVTSYNQNEAGDDEDVLDELMPFKWLWRPEKNPRGASTPRATDNEDGVILKENNYWMCLTGRP